MNVLIVVGKLSQSQMHTKVEFVRHQDRIAELFSDKSIEIKSCSAVADGSLQATYEKKAEMLHLNHRSQMVRNRLNYY